MGERVGFLSRESLLRNADPLSVHSPAEEGFGFRGDQHDPAARTRDTEHENFGHEPADIFRFEIHHT
jgi:hypothetical protein